MNVSHKTKATSRQNQATGQAHDGMDFIILADRGHWMTMGTAHCIVPTVSQEA